MDSFSRRKKSSALFWVKHASLALALVVIAAVVIHLQLSYEAAPQPEGGKTTKSVGEGLSKFYEEYRLSSSRPHLEDKGDFVMELSTSSQPLDSRLKKMESLQKPIATDWAGDHKFRTFKTGSTLREAITSFAQGEGMQVIWELDKDFIVKHQFQMDDTITGSLKTIANAVDSSFEERVYAYICTKQRALVITQKDTQYLQTNCELVM